MAGKSALDILKRILLFFRRNWGLKLISLFFAVILWNYVIVEVNPVRPVMITDVPVLPAGQNVLKNNNLTVSGDITTYMKPVDVVLDLPRSDVARYNRNNITVTADLSNITREGDAEVTLTCNVPVKSITPPKLRFKIENLGKNRVPVTVVYENSQPAGYEIDNASTKIDPSVLDITGPYTIVQTIAKAVIKVDANKLTSDFSQSTEVELQDKNGNPVDSAGLEYITSCIVNLKVLKTKTVKISDPAASLNGEPAKGYRIVSVDIDPTEIAIAGQPNVIDTIDSIKLGTVDIAGATATTSISKPLKLPSGVTAVNGNTAQVTVKIEPVLTTVTLTGVPIKIADLDPSLKVDQTQTFTATVTLTCPELSAKRIKRTYLTLYVDTANLAEGTHTLTVKATYDDPDAGVTDISVSTPDILVRLVSSTAAP